MNLKQLVNPLPFPPIFSDQTLLKLILGVGLSLAGVLIFSMWKERFFKLKEEERMRFLMFNIFGGAWLLAIFAVCGGVYFLCDSIFKFVT